VISAKFRQRMQQAYQSRHSPGLRVRAPHPLPDDPMAWLLTTFAAYFRRPGGQSIPLAAHHEEFWRWVWSLRLGHAAPPFIAVWPRGGGKSVSAELACASMGYFGLRRYGLYISATQAQADDHVQNVGTMFEALGVERSVNKYGLSRGWRINRLRTAMGFTLDAVGLDVSIRGARLDESRPDVIILDDLDLPEDTAATTAKKIRTLTRSLLPAGAPSLAVLGTQNVPNADGIFAQLVDGRAEFLLDRVVSGPFPALLLAEGDWWQREMDAAGHPRIRITRGTPVWEGQGLAECETLLTQIGLQAFLVECQHETSRLQGTMFQRQWFSIVEDVPAQARKVRYWDLAGTEERPGTDPDWTAGALVAEQRGQYWLCDMRRGRLSPRGVEALVAQTAALDGRQVPVYIEQEPGSSGKIVITDYQQDVLKGYSVAGVRSTGSKLVRARPVSSAAEVGNILLVNGPWITAFLDEAVAFPDGAHDDQIDALSGAMAALMDQPKVARALGR